MSERERTSSDGKTELGRKDGTAAAAIARASKHPGPSAAQNGQQRAAEFAFAFVFATSLFATSRSLAAAKKPTGPGGGRGGPHATRANRSVPKGQRAGHVGRQKRAKG